jgi:hypothetical protein
VALLGGNNVAAAAPKPKAGTVASVATDTPATLVGALVYQDGLGNFYVVRMPPDTGLDGFRVYAGNGKSMYLQESISVNRDTGHGEWGSTLHAPRSETGRAEIKLVEGKVTLQCQADAPLDLTPASPDQAKQILNGAKFVKAPHNRVPHVLARDDDGNYYFVDRLEGSPKRGFRVFAGLKGAMKEMPMTNVVSDSAGEIFATKSGELKIITKTADNTASWRKGKVRTDLTLLPIQLNAYLIARELGVYGRMGYVCDDL